MTPKMRRLRREFLDIPFEFDVTMEEILEDLFHPTPLRTDPHDRLPAATPRRSAPPAR